MFPPISGVEAILLFGRFRLLAAMVILAAGLARAQGDLGEATLEQLLNTKITSVSKKEQTLSQTAAAVYVINQDDIRRSGATNIPDLLRLVPGVEVAQINANRWAIAIRGFNDAYSNKVLVLVDGRSVYSGTFSGVIWDQVGIPPEQIERIEVILGPGGSVWGANAVDGVISIVTKSSAEMKRGMVSTGGGSSALTNDAVRYGGTVGAKGSYEVFGQYSRTADFLTPSGLDAGDGWDRKQGGFRSDWNLSPATSMSVEGDYFLNHGNQVENGGLFATGGPFYDLDFFARGGDIEGQWRHTFAGGSEESVQVYYSSSSRLEQGAHIAERSLDLEYQDRFHLGSRHDVVVGFGYRRDTGSLTGSDWIVFLPPSKTDNLVNGFVQDEISISPTVRLTVGSKLEHNSYTGFEFEPTIRLAWAATSKSTFWVAASRAITQPGQWETSIQAIAGVVPLGNTTAVITLTGNPQLKAENVLDYELGYRRQLAGKVSLDLATFAASYHNLMGVLPVVTGITQTSEGEILVPTVVANALSQLNYGAEASVTWDVVDRWRLTTAYALLEQTSLGGPGLNLGPGTAVDPKHMFQTHSRLNLPGKLELDPWIWWTSGLAANNIPGHARVNVRVGRRLGESAEISVTGQNLLSPRFVEYGNSYGFAGMAVPRSVFGKLTWYF